MFDYQKFQEVLHKDNPRYERFKTSSLHQLVELLKNPTRQADKIFNEMKGKDWNKYKNTKEYLLNTIPGLRNLFLKKLPSVDTIVDDLRKKSIVGIGAKPSSDLTSNNSMVSKEFKVKYKSVDVEVTISDFNRFSCKGPSNKPNATYLHYEDKWSTIAKINSQWPILISGNFSGCGYKIFKGEGSIICAHIYRGGTNPDEYVELIKKHAKQKQWTEIQNIDTKGLVGGGCSEVIIVSHLKGSCIDSILLKVNNRGIIVDSTYFQASV